MSGQGTIVATGSIGYPPGLGNIGAAIGAEKVMTMTSTYDHRIIQGAESGQFLQVVEAYLQGEHDFYEQVFKDLGAQLGAAPQAPAPALTAAETRDGARSPRGARRRRRPGRRHDAPGRPGRGLAAEGPPHARPPRRAAGPARRASPRATPRSTRSRSA